MDEREIRDNEGIIWKCVQAFSGVNGNADKILKEKSINDDGTVTVVGTPSGGEQTVRLNLKKDWRENLSDENLLNKILKSKEQN